MIHNLFPQPVGMYKLERDLTEKEIDFIKGQETRPNMGNVTSTDNTVLRNRSMTKLRDFIESSVSEYFKTIHNPKHQVSLRVTQSWINYTEPGQFHHKHAHPNSFVSGVFYPQANKATDRIYFYRDGFQMIKLPPQDWNIWNSESWWFATTITCVTTLFASSWVKCAMYYSSIDSSLRPVKSISSPTKPTGKVLKERLIRVSSPLTVSTM